MSLLDIIVIGIIISFTLVAAAWGIIRQLIALGGLIAGIWLAGLLNPGLAKAVGFTDNPAVAQGLAFLAVVVIVSILSSVVASLLYFFVGLLFLGWLDHVIGAAIGFVQGVLALGVFMVAALTLAPDWTQQQLAQSFLANRMVGALTGFALLLAPQDLKQIVDLARTRI